MTRRDSVLCYPHAGFALVLTIALLTLIVLLLLGLATVTRIQTATVANSQKQAQARQNALLALDLALGQLQKFAGPDQRVTTTAQSFAASNLHYTGVWDAAARGPTPLTWLVSGNEGDDALAVTPGDVGPNLVELGGKQTTGSPDEIVVPKRPISTAGLPGQSTAVTIGNYAWWVGDQGVKAAVALTDPIPGIVSAPYDSAELRNRLRQQLALGAGPAEFEPRDAQNAPLIPRIIAFNQLALLKLPDASALGLVTLRQNFSVWSPSNFAVLANTREGGLRQDLSLQPELLGQAFAAWANYKIYLEDPASAAKSPAPNPDIATAESMRRRYRITPPVSDQGVAARGGACALPVPVEFRFAHAERRGRKRQNRIAPALDRGSVESLQQRAGSGRLAARDFGFAGGPRIHRLGQWSDAREYLPRRAVRLPAQTHIALESDQGRSSRASRTRHPGCRAEPITGPHWPTRANRRTATTVIFIRNR